MTTASGKQAVILNSRKATYGYDQRVEAFGSKGMAISDNRRPHHMLMSGDGYSDRAAPLLNFFIERYREAFDAEIDASDAFVAAWLPGSEGGGIADLLIGDSHGAPRYDFSGTLSFAWPGSAAAAAPAPKFARGYGLHYPAGTTQGCNPTCAPD